MFRDLDLPECGWIEDQDIWRQEEVSMQSADYPVAWVDVEHPKQCASRLGD